MSNAELLSIPDIPEDIVRSILETLAIMSRPDALQLVLVSKTVRKWIEIILYHAVTILTLPKLCSFAYAIQSREAAGDTSFFANTVRYLLLDVDLFDNHSPYTEHDVKSFAAKLASSLHTTLCACTGLVSLGLRYYDSRLVASLLNFALPCLKQLSLSNIGPDYPLQRLPPNITHLRYQSGHLPLTLLQAMPLTHLHVTLDKTGVSDEGVAAMRQVLEAMPTTVQLCIFSFENDDVDLEALNEIRDPRVITLDIIAATSYYLGSVGEDLPKYDESSQRDTMRNDCGFLPDGELDCWEFCANLVTEKAKRYADRIAKLQVLS